MLLQGRRGVDKGGSFWGRKPGILTTTQHSTQHSTTQSTTQPAAQYKTEEKVEAQHNSVPQIKQSKTQSALDNAKHNSGSKVQVNRAGSIVRLGTVELRQSRAARCSLDIVQGRKNDNQEAQWAHHVLSLHPKIHSGDMSCLCRLRREHNAQWLTMFELPCIQICSNMLKSFKHTAL